MPAGVFYRPDNQGSSGGGDLLKVTRMESGRAEIRTTLSAHGHTLLGILASDDWNLPSPVATPGDVAIDLGQVFVPL